MRVQIKYPRGSQTKLEIRRVDDSGKPVGLPHRSSFSDASDYIKVAKKLSVNVNKLIEWIDDFSSQLREKDTPYLYATEAEQRDYSVTLRGVRESAVSGQRYSSIDDALAVSDYPAPEPLITWKDSDAIAAVDVDRITLSEQQLYDFVLASLRARSRFAWRTKSGGLRLLYVGNERFAAIDMAAAALLNVKQFFPASRCELKTDTRHPLYIVSGKPCGPVWRFEQTADLSALQSYFFSDDASSVEASEWLSDRGFTVGEAYPHDKCPVDPHATSSDERGSVKVFDDHIFCWVCNANGRCFGSRTPGYFPFRKLLGKGESNLLAACIENVTHYGHAQYVAKEAIQDQNDVLARAVYRASLRVRHGPDDPRVSQAFTAGDNLIRLDNRWATINGESLVSSRGAIREVLKRLPALYYLTETGSLEIATDRLAMFEQGIDLGRYGYPSLSIIWGCRIWSHNLALPEHRAYVVMQTGVLKGDQYASFRPRYLPPDRRVSDAWAAIDDLCPGIDRNVIRLLIAARGCAEGGLGMPPMVFLYGPTASGKTMSVRIAAAICGDGVHTIRDISHTDRLHQGIHKTKETGTFALFDEALKNAGRLSPVQAMEPLLTFTPDSLAHKMYVGPVPLGQLPALIWADTTIPQEIAEHSQIARRLIHVRLSERKEWTASLVSSHAQMENLRVLSTKYADACNAILSEVIDEFFVSEMTFEEIARALGFAPLEESPEAQGKLARVREFFAAVCDASAATPQQLVGISGSGWKAINTNDGPGLSAYWRTFRDEENRTRSRSLQEIDLRSVCGLKCAAKLETQDIGNDHIVVKFVSLDGTLTNEELRA